MISDKSETLEVSDSPPRRFTLGDGMVLVASSAISLVLLRIAISLDLFTIDPWSPSPGREFLEQMGLAGGCVLAPLAIGLLVLGLRDRRVSRRAGIPGTGFAACAAVGLAAILPMAFFVTRIVTTRSHPGGSRFLFLNTNYNNLFVRLNFESGSMIMGAWLTLVLMGRWRIEQSWIGRLGCLVELGFVSMYLCMQLWNILHPIRLW